MYDSSDPRAALAPEQRPATHKLQFHAADFAKFYETPPQEEAANFRTWYCRGQNFVVAYTDAQPGAQLSRAQQVDEYVVLIPDRQTSVEVTAPNEQLRVDGYSLIIMPPGESTISLPLGGIVYRLFTTENHDVAEFSSNGESYAEPHDNVASLQKWPAPVGGFKVRPYSLDVPASTGRFGRIWRCTTFMVNYGAPRVGQRDITKMSPHSHDDFEQCSLAVEGDFVHHIRWPWLTDMSKWRDDVHEFCGSPSVAIIPPPSIHTSEAKGAGTNQLVDIFCPPRLDFSLKAGWILNEDEYPLPPEAN